MSWRKGTLGPPPRGRGETHLQCCHSARCTDVSHHWKNSARCTDVQQLIMMVLSSLRVRTQGNSSRATPSLRSPALHNRPIMRITNPSMPYGIIIGGREWECGPQTVPRPGRGLIAVRRSLVCCPLRGLGLSHGGAASMGRRLPWPSVRSLPPPGFLAS